MHLLSLCMLYALGLKENTRSDGQVVVTPGGEFRDGFRVIQKLRDIATFFNTPSRLQKLKEIKKLYNLPPADVKIDAKTRVGYAVSLMRRSVYNYYAFTKYFELAPDSDQSVWTRISKDDWILITEMEAITDQLAQFCLGEVQKESIASSYALLFRRLLSLAVESTAFQCLVLERPDSEGTEFTQRRISRRVYEFSPGGVRCRDRLRQQLAFRFPIEDINDVKALLLDPRIKSKAASIVNDASILARAESELQLEHYAIYRKIFERRGGNHERSETQEECQSETLDSVSNSHCAVDQLLAIDGPVASSEAKNAWNYWASLNVKWPNVSTNNSKYNALLLYREVDILAWFREHGSGEFPAIAILARIYLAKPLSTAIQERFFSISGYVVNELRTQLDDEWAEMMCLIKANWNEYQQLVKEK